jgi:hypothetical protein
MFHYVESITDVKGNALTGYYVGLVQPDSSDDDGGVDAVIYADDSATAIIADSGVDNRAKVDADGLVSLYVPPATYHVDIYAPDSVTKVKRLLNIPMQSGQPGESATIAIGTVTTLPPGSNATVTNVGSASNAILDFEIPMGVAGSGTTFAWGAATGTLSNQTDLQNALNLKAALASPALTGTPTAPTAALGDNSTQIATTAFVLANAAGLASPAFTGTPTAPTAAADTDTMQLATTAYVLAQANSVNSVIAMNGAQNAGTSLKYARADHVHPTDTTKAPLASPGFTGTPTAPTAAAGTNTTQLATTAFVQTAISGISDPWVVVKRTSDGTGTSAALESTGLTVAGSSFLPSSYYEFEAQISVKVASPSNLNIALVWPSGVTGSASIAAYDGTTIVAASGDASGTITTATLGNSTTLKPVTIRGHFYTGSLAPTGSLDIQYKNAGGSAIHTISKGSVLRYRAL